MMAGAMEADLLLFAFYMCVIGAGMGTFTGLVPGIHVNTLALMLMAFSGPLTDIISSFAPAELAPLLLSTCVLSAAVVHSATDFVPSVFLGVPDPDSVLNVLPGHRLLLDGKGMTAVRCAAIGSIVGAAASLVLAIPMHWLLSSGLGGYLDSITVGFLIAVLVLMVVTEKGSRRAAVLIVPASGALGLVCMTGMVPMESLLGGEPEIMLPLLSGLFGVPSMLLPADGGRIPAQTDTDTRPVGVLPGLKGVVTGSVTGWFPGVTSNTGASLAGCIFGEEDEKGFISMVSSIGTASTMFTFVTFCVNGNERSGTMTVIGGLLGGSAVAPGTDAFAVMMFAMAVSSAIAYPVTIRAGKLMCGLVERVDIRRLNACVLAFMTALTIAFTGYWGLVVLLAGGLLGMVPVLAGCGRTHLTGCLIVPVLLFKLGLF